MKWLLCLLLLGCGPAKLPIDGGNVRRMGEDVYWQEDDFPLEILIDPDMDPVTQLAVIVAAELWNQEVNRPVFRATVAHTANTDCNWVSVSQYDIHHNNLARRDHWDAFYQASLVDGTANVCSGRIAIDTDLPVFWLVPIIQHELGHSLNLAHDGELSSLMHPHVRNMPLPREVQVEDIRRVRAVVDGYYNPYIAAWSYRQPRVIN